MEFGSRAILSTSSIETASIFYLISATISAESALYIVAVNALRVLARAEQDVQKLVDVYVFTNHDVLGNVRTSPAFAKEGAHHVVQFVVLQDAANGSFVQLGHGHSVRDGDSAAFLLLEDDVRLLLVDADADRFKFDLEQPPLVLRLRAAANESIV
jgi:hypothetical protein